MIRELLSRQKDKNKISVIEGDREVSYAELIQKAEKIQQVLPQEQQKKIALLLPDGSEFLSALYAIFVSGNAALPINILMNKNEIIGLINQAKIDTVITSLAYESVFENTYKKLIFIENFDNNSNVIVNVSEGNRDFSFNEVCSKNKNFVESFDLNKAKLTDSSSRKIEQPYIEKQSPYFLESCSTQCEDHSIESSEIPLLFLSTSGTTETTKIVGLSEKNIVTAVFGYFDKLIFKKDLSGSYRYILCVPFSSVYGIMIIMACLFMSFPIIVCGTAFTLGGLFLAAEKHKATHFEGSSSVLLQLEKMLDKKLAIADSLRYFGFGGSKISGTVIEKIQNKYTDKEFYQGYGMTEASPLIAKHPQKKLKKFESVGTAIKGVKIAIDSGGILSDTPFTIGEILVSGDNVMQGYLDNQAETDSIIKNGYLYTGDIGYLDDEGYLFISGRKKNMVILRGFKVFPETVEECILNSGFVLDCVVYGEMDVGGNETLCAEIVPKNDNISKTDIQSYCAGHLADYKIPRKILFVDKINKNINGKTDRKRYKASAEK